jgi:hypothetical protein
VAYSAHPAYTSLFGSTIYNKLLISDNSQENQMRHQEIFLLDKQLPAILVFAEYTEKPRLNSEEFMDSSRADASDYLAST